MSFGSGQEVCFGPSRPDPGRKAPDQDGTRTGRDLDADGAWTGARSDPGEGLDGTPDTVTDV